METCIKHIDLPNGLRVSVYDTTRRYYEDYHLVRLEFICRVPLCGEYFDGVESFDEAKKLLGESAVYCRTCEKMGVPFADIESARESIIADFIKNALPYFTAESFPRKLVQSEYAKARDKTGRFRM
jgi:hypothetical protein